MKRIALGFSTLLMASAFFAASASWQIPIDTMKDSTIDCDYLIVAPDSMITPALQLAEHRNSFAGDGVENAHVACLEKIMIEFNGSDFKKRNETLWQALKWAYDNWRTPPKYLVLIGDDTYEIDPVDSSAYSIGRMPTWYQGGRVSAYKDIPDVYTSDDYFTSLLSDDPDTEFSEWFRATVYIGRIPAPSALACSLYVEKVKQYDRAGGDRSWRNSIIAIADDRYQNRLPDQVALSVPFQAACERILSTNKGFFIRKEFLAPFPFDELNHKPEAKQSIWNAMNNGAGFVLFEGHGNSMQLTDEQVLLNSDCNRFNNDSMPIVFISMTSRNGSFFMNNGETMCKQYLFLERGGCIAYIGSTGETYANANEDFAKGLFGDITGTVRESLGQIMYNAKKRNSASGLDNGYYLLGDPALRVLSETAVPLALKPVRESENAATLSLSITGGSPWPDPLDYRIEFSFEDSVIPADSFEIPFVRDSVFSIATGKISQQSTVPIPVSQQLKIKATAYVWNTTADGHALVTINTSDMSVAAFKAQPPKKGLSSPITIKNSILTISPAFTNQKATVLQIFDLKGKQIYSSKLQPGLTRFDLSTAVPSAGRYVLHLQSGTQRIGKPFVLIK